MEVPLNHCKASNFTLEKKTLMAEDKNEIIHVSALNSDFLKRVLPFSVCEIRQLPDLENPVHIIVDKDAQKLIQTFHRYGPSTNRNDQFCPFAQGRVQERFISLIGKNNLLTALEETSKKKRSDLLSFFTRKKMKDIEDVCITVTHNWVQEQIRLQKVPLFDSCLSLIGECLLKAIIGYSKCKPEDVRLNQEFWKNLLANKPSQLKSADSYESENVSFFSSIGNFFDDGTDLLMKLKTYLIDSSEIDSLCLKIFDKTLYINDSLANYLYKKSFNKAEILENIKGILLGAQETTGYLFSFLLYEYAKNPEMQQMHRGNKEKIKCAYLEALRLYSVGGSLREADMDMVLAYSDKKGNKKEHYIRKGDLINTFPLLAGHDPAEFENPEKFNPERKNIQAVRDNPHFGTGPNRCIGEKVAEMEILTCITQILSKVNMQIDEPLPPLANNFTVRPAHDMSVYFFRKLI